MKKINKLFLAAGSIAAVAAPVAAVVSCGSSSDELAVNTGGYAGSFQKLANGDITVAGAWGDARFYAGAQASNIEVVGVETTKISNDGIQAREDLSDTDTLALQEIFAKLITDSKSIAELKPEFSFKDEKGKDYKASKPIFSIYSHDDYTPIYKGQKVNAMNTQGNPEFVDTNATIEQTQVASLKTANAGSIFETTTDTSKSVAGWKTRDGQRVKIAFIPSNDPSNVQTATQALSTYLKAHGIVADINVSNNYDAAASQLASKQLDIAFLPVETWFEGAPKSKFIIQAARPQQVTTLDFSTQGSAKINTNEITDEKLAVELFNKYGQLYLKDVKTYADSDDAAIDAAATAKTISTQVASQLKALIKAAKASTTSHEAEIVTLAKATADAAMNAGSYEAWIYAKIGSDFDTEVKAKATTNKWTEDWATAKPNVIYGYTSTTSASSYVYPELWFKAHFTGFTSFQD